MNTRQLKKEIVYILSDQGWHKNMNDIARERPLKIVSPLISLLYDQNDLIKWRAVASLGMTCHYLALDNLERVRIIIRRLMWSLNDESGGIGWGAPEAMAEILATHKILVHEYHHIFISYIIKDKNYLEHPILQKGVLWGIGRLSLDYPTIMKKSIPYVRDYSYHDQVDFRGLAIWIYTRLKHPISKDILDILHSDEHPFTLFIDNKIQTVSIKQILADMIHATALKE